MIETQPGLMRRHFVWSGLLLLAVMLFARPAQAAFDVTNPLNILPGAGRTITVSSAFAGNENAGFGLKTGLIDNNAANQTEDAPFLFAQSDSPNRLSISGFNGAFGIIRIFTAADPSRQPTSITVKSSTSLVTTLNAGDYETTLLSSYATGVVYPTTGITLTPYDGPARGYFDLQLTTAAPSGTQSLFLSLAAPTSGIRIYELQALAVPEPSSLSLLGGTILFLWRKRRT